MGLSSLWPLSSIEMYFSLVPSMDAALTWLGSHVSLRSFRARLDRADGTLTGRDRMRLFGSAVSLHAPIRSCGGLGSPRPARDMSGNEGSPMGASGMWGHRAVRI